MGKYDPLTAYLKQQFAAEVPLSFDELAQIIGSPLPASAYTHRSWWANESVGHVHATAWLEAGFAAVQVNLAGRTLIFRRIPPRPYDLADDGRDFESEEMNKPMRHPLVGSMKGTFTIEPGWDLTRPALDPEELEAWEASIDRKADLIEEGLAGKKR